MHHPLRRMELGLGLGLVGILLVALAAVGLRPAGATASTRFVGHGPAGDNSSCSSPGYTSVQAAIDAANAGDTVHLCGTVPYTEQVIVAKSITLTGDTGAAIQAPNPFPSTALTRLPPQFTSDKLFIPQAVLIVWGPRTRATIRNLTVAGVLQGNGGCAEEEYGILVIDGAYANISGNTVQDIRDSNSALYGCQFGVGIAVGREYWPTASGFAFIVENFVGSATITGNTVNGYQKDGITIDGYGGSATVSGNTVVGAGRSGPLVALSQIIAQNGIEILVGARGSVSNNNVSNNTYLGSAPASASGIALFGGCGDPLVTNVTASGNTLTNDDVGIYLNDFTANPSCTAPATTVTNLQARNNTLTNTAISNVGPETFNSTNYSGYQAGIDDIGNGDSIIGNSISGVGYTPAQTTANGPYIQPIDIYSFPTINPTVSGNTFHAVTSGPVRIPWRGGPVHTPARGGSPSRMHRPRVVPFLK
jgi:hypothetical protein